ncbi:hypothetical protein [Cohnella panacarvi]|uniref:hypothetical protein n=1 Tax=Cohnella panacarvi TaxID=400776 RepID=UPI00047AE0C3|nr:hypothetical protein [Cohnella panacarvi]
MLVIGTFPNDTRVMQAVLALEKSGVGKDRMLVVPMDHSPDTANSHREIGNPISGHTSVEFGLAFATAVSVIGISRGFMLAWGPILWGLISAASGFALGFGIHKGWERRRMSVMRRKKSSDITVLVECEAAERKLIVSVLWNHDAFAVGECPNDYVNGG